MHSASHSTTHSTAELMIILIFQLSAIIIASRLFGFLVKRYLKQPSIIGELISGIIIGPYALGSIPVPFLNGAPLFPLISGATFPISPELYGFATFASIILLFLSGLETDPRAFLRFATTGFFIGLGGFISTFFLGAFSAVIMVREIHSIMDPAALFMGVIATATSVGITAQILSEQRKLSSPEGVTILSSAVVDDVLGIILLSIIVGLVKNNLNPAQIEWPVIGRIALKAFGFWAGSTAIGMLISPWLTRILKKVVDLKSLAVICLGLALLLAGFSELAGLAMIIGAFVMGLALSGTDVSEDITQRLTGLRNIVVPIFFCVMGMLVNFYLFPKILIYGLAYTAAGIIGKLFGCGLPALLTGFNQRGAFRIGAGMLPRGEVTLIIAGIGLVSGAISNELFGVAIMSMFITSLVASPIIIKSFSGSEGFKKSLNTRKSTKTHSLAFDMPNIQMTELVKGHLLNAFRNAAFFPRQVGDGKPVYSIQQNNSHITLLLENTTIRLNFPVEQENFVRLLIAEELLSLKELFRDVEKVFQSDIVERNLLGSLFNG